MIQKRFYNIQELATILGKTVSAVHSHLARQQIDAVPPPMRLGRRLAWLVESVDDWIDTKAAQATIQTEEWLKSRHGNGLPHHRTESAIMVDNQLDKWGDDHPDAQDEPRAYGLMTELPFRLACEMACVRPGTHPDMQSDAQVAPRYSLRGTFCDHGLSALQINVLALVHRVGARITPYDRIARQLAQEFDMTQSAESVRGIVNRLAVRGFIRRKQAREGTTRGVRFTTIDVLLCPHITGNRPDVRSSVQTYGESGLDSSKI